MEVILTPENEASLRDFVHGIIVDEIEKARRDTAVDKRVLNQTEIAKYFNVSTTTIREWEKLGLPHGSVSKQGKFLSLIHISEPTRPRLISYAVFCLNQGRK